AGGPRAATAAGAAAATARERDRTGSGPQRSIGQIVGVSVVGLVVLLALLFAFGVIGGGDEKPSAENQPPTSTTQPNTSTRAATPRYPRADMKTLVYNASGTSGLAKGVSDRIEEEFRFPMGQAVNYNTIAGGTDLEATTTVQYRTGADQSVSQNRAAAQDVARFLKLKTNSTVVKRMTPIVSAGSAGQKVVVVIGADYARANPTAGAGQSGSATGSTNPATPPASGGAAGGTASTTTTTTAPDTGGQLSSPNTTDLGTDGGVDDGTGGTTVP
ncbi:MAG: LytR family transcriptional regulator, partial [Rhizobacter sp.]|nr:LytR family transcriptional regulator [Rhizobacter sp.]